MIAVQAPSDHEHFYKPEEGDEFKRGQIIAEVDSDKTTVELPALEDGKLTKIISKEGEEIEVGSDIAIFESV